MKKILRLNNNKKGTEKPIEIFLALFIILAVSMVMLKVFQSQIQDQTGEMDRYTLEAELIKAIEEAEMKCQSLCSSAVQAGCTPRAITTYCIQRVSGVTDAYLDLNKDGVNGFYEAGGVGLCEDSVYCPHITDCTCGQRLTFPYCVRKACEYWLSIGDETAANTRLDRAYVTVPSEACIENMDEPLADLEHLMWYYGLADVCAEP